MSLLPHPYAAIFPLIEGADFDELVASVRANGLRENIVLHEGKILDGRNRYRACLEAGLIAPDDAGTSAHFAVFDAARHGDPLQFVLDHNLTRRHLTDDQRRMVAARIANLGRGGDRKSEDFKGANGPIDRSRAAEMLAVDEMGVKRARKVVTKGAAELQAAVDQRRVTVRMAYDLASLPVAEQREIMASADPKVIKAAAKTIRAKQQATRHVVRQELAERMAAKNPALPAEGRTFPLVLIDIPRKHRSFDDVTGSEKAPDNHYPTMTFRETLDFPIDRFAARNAILLYWSTAASLVDDLDIIADWGFVAMRPRGADGRLLRDAAGEPLPATGGGRYGSHQVWRKRRAGNAQGMGRWFRDQHELLIVARRGDVPAPLPGTQAESVLEDAVTGHSAKPNDATLAWIDRCWPHLSKIYVFARGAAPKGWVFWGNEAPAPEQGERSEPADHRGANGAENGERVASGEVAKWEGGAAIGSGQSAMGAGPSRPTADRRPPTAPEDDGLDIPRFLDRRPRPGGESPEQDERSEAVANGAEKARAAGEAGVANGGKEAA